MYVTLSMTISTLLHQEKTLFENLKLYKAHIGIATDTYPTINNVNRISINSNGIGRAPADPAYIKHLSSNKPPLLQFPESLKLRSYRMTTKTRLQASLSRAAAREAPSIGQWLEFPGYQLAKTVASLGEDVRNTALSAHPPSII